MKSANMDVKAATISTPFTAQLQQCLALLSMQQPPQFLIPQWVSWQQRWLLIAIELMANIKLDTDPSAPLIVCLPQQPTALQANIFKHTFAHVSDVIFVTEQQADLFGKIINDPASNAIWVCGIAAQEWLGACVLLQQSSLARCMVTSSTDLLSDVLADCALKGHYLGLVIGSQDRMLQLKTLTRYHRQLKWQHLVWINNCFTEPSAAAWPFLLAMVKAHYKRIDPTTAPCATIAVADWGGQLLTMVFPNHCLKEQKC